uniref:Uncharacterized protein n=1 Tax=Anguilla anguilla TaxID=7936 RepID=A0A0E9PGZ0_ANGAN
MELQLNDWNYCTEPQKCSYYFTLRTYHM